MQDRLNWNNIAVFLQFCVGISHKETKTINPELICPHENRKNSVKYSSYESTVILLTISSQSRNISYSTWRKDGKPENNTAFQQNKPAKRSIAA